MSGMKTITFCFCFLLDSVDFSTAQRTKVSSIAEKKRVDTVNAAEVMPQVTDSRPPDEREQIRRLQQQLDEKSKECEQLFEKLQEKEALLDEHENTSKVIFQVL